MIISDPDPDPTHQLISDPDPGRSFGSFWVRLRIRNTENNINIKMTYIRTLKEKKEIVFILYTLFS